MHQPSSHPAESSSPPQSRAIRWYRILLWLMPTCVALATAFGGMALESIAGWAKPFGAVWWAVNAFSTLGLGLFDSMFRPPESRETFESTVTFFIVQLIFVPVGLVALSLLLLLLLPGSW